MTREDVQKIVEIGACFYIVCGNYGFSYIVTAITDDFLELEYLNKTPTEFGCRIGYRSIQAISPF